MTAVRVHGPSGFDDEIRSRLADEGISETFLQTVPEPDSTKPVDVRIMLDAKSEPEAEATIMRALRGIGYELRSGFAWLN